MKRFLVLQEILLKYFFLCILTIRSSRYYTGNVSYGDYVQSFLDNFHLYLPKTFTDIADVVRHIMISHIPSLKSLTEVAKTE